MRQNYRIIELPGLTETLKITYFQLPAMDTFQHTRLLHVLSNLALDPSRVGISTVSQGSLQGFAREQDNIRW